jgi:hypothetical protein
LAGVTEDPRDESPDDEHEDEHLSDATPSGVDWSELFAPINETIKKIMSPIAETTRAQLQDALKPIIEQTQASIAAAMPKIELPPLPTFKLPPGLVETLARIRESRPPNWPDRMDYDRLTEVIQADGIPLVWVPRAAIVSELLAAKDRPARIAILAAHRSEIVEDCRTVLATVNDPSYVGKMQLALQAVDALDTGHDEAAQALATVVVESSTRLAIDEQSKKVQNRVRIDLDDVAYVEIRLRAALAPLDVFYTDWHPTMTPNPMPDALSRHVTCHCAEPTHFTEGNALTAILLAASVLRALQELDALRAAIGDPTWLRK